MIIDVKDGKQILNKDSCGVYHFVKGRWSHQRCDVQSRPIRTVTVSNVTFAGQPIYGCQHFYKSILKIPLNRLPLISTCKEYYLLKRQYLATWVQKQKQKVFTGPIWSLMFCDRKLRQCNAAAPTVDPQSWFEKSLVMEIWHTNRQTDIIAYCNKILYKIKAIIHWWWPQVAHFCRYSWPSNSFTDKHRACQQPTLLKSL